MVDAVTMVAVALLVGGVVGTLVPLVPGGLLSLSGVYLYWWTSGFGEPGTITIVILTVLGAVTIFAEFFAGALAARVGGASWTTTTIAGVVAVVSLLVVGPVGLLIGLFGTVFVVEYLRRGDANHSARSALFATVGTLASSAIQAMLTATMLFVFVVSVFAL
ncbi:DUF456 domain-containing protein [Natronorubrum daqingense]|uniref:DUF456 domain-containing protein n=1 Tax=Natronorubrum daqingense TaxID=588898 RepID=A0A1N7ED43_9EURY|nr:DUF456 domain-containing protein [Natronorubrum daqingense]APX96503.1 hypothetical protein BB347_07670 [Natronorubrum daqingense]SIR86062.1 hypothetical protein SAMN05421809_2627 [Natronorubrum daqingense]